MSSSDRDGSAMKPTADETVPRMNDTTNEEIWYYKNNSFWGDHDDGADALFRSWYLSPGIVSLHGLLVLTVGVWALVQGTSYFSKAMLPTTSVFIVSALLVIVGVVMILGGFAHILYIRFSGTHKNSTIIVRFALMLSFHLPLSVIVVTLGITAVALSDTQFVRDHSTQCKYYIQQLSQWSECSGELW